MQEKEATREQEVELPEFSPSMKGVVEWMKREVEGLRHGQIVIKGSQVPFELDEQNITRKMVVPGMTHTATDNMSFFIHHIPIHSGRHTHQGGLAFFVIQGKGSTAVDGQRFDWEEGDLLLLPIKPGGVEHQHFNRDPGVPARWVAMFSRLYREALGRPNEQREVHPDWKKKYGDRERRRF